MKAIKHTTQIFWLRSGNLLKNSSKVKPLRGSQTQEINALEE
jgi:hypothetical protein